jgi:glycogen operon protein
VTTPALGAHVNGDGVDFAVYSSVADAVEVALFERGDEARHSLERDDRDVWRGHIGGAGHGTRYGFRAYGPWEPAAGLRCNAAKLLLDPYARAIAGAVEWNAAVYGDNDADSSPYVPRSVVSGDSFDWGADASPATALADSIIYELHVKGFTRLHPEIPEELRGTYAGLAHPAAIAHLQLLGVSAVELLPVHQFVHDAALVTRGLRNYWGYQSIGYFAPLRRRHRLRQHARHPPPAGIAAGHGLAALLGSGDACRRLSVRPRRQPRPRDQRLRPIRRLPGRRRTGPRAVAGQAHRRAMGRRTGRL